MDNYYNPRTGLSGIYTMYKAQHNKTLNQVKEIIQRQEPYQLNKQKGIVNYFPIVGHGPNSFQADLMFLDNDRGYNNILCIINVITRVAHAYPQKSKADTYDNLKKFYEEVPNVEHLQTDKGSEFTNKKVKGLFQDIDYYQVDTSYSQGKIERFNQTLRRLVTIYQSGHKTTKWYDIIPDLLYNYNHRFHSSLGCSPLDANEDEEFAKLLGKYDLANDQLMKYKVGNRVRVLLNKDLFQKGRAEWSSDVFRIESIDGHKLIVNGKPFQYYQLQLVGNVHKKLFDDNDEVNKEAIKKEKKVKRDIRKEGVDDKNVIEYGKNLIGRRVKDGKDSGVIFKYDRNGNFKWWVRFDRSDRDNETMDLKEIKGMLV